MATIVGGVRWGAPLDHMPPIRLELTDAEMPPRMAHLISRPDGWGVWCGRCHTWVETGIGRRRDAQSIATFHNGGHRA